MVLLVLDESDTACKAAGVDDEGCGALEVMERVLATVHESALRKLKLTGEAAPKGLEGGVSERQVNRDAQDRLRGGSGPFVRSIG